MTVHTGRRSHGLRRRRSWIRTGVRLPGGGGCHSSGMRSIPHGPSCAWRLPDSTPRWCWKPPRLYRADRPDATERLLALAAGVNAEQCPFNDPHPAAPPFGSCHLRAGCRRRTGPSRHRGHAALAAPDRYRRIHRGQLRPASIPATRLTNPVDRAKRAIQRPDAGRSDGASHRGHSGGRFFPFPTHPCRVMPPRCRRLGGSGYPSQGAKSASGPGGLCRV